MDKIINEIRDKVVSSHNIRECKEFIEAFAAAQLKYDKLMDMLSDEQIAAFEEYESAEGKVKSVEARENFKLGVKTGFKLACETFDKE